jgi:hypothetical protein
MDQRTHAHGQGECPLALGTRMRGWVPGMALVLCSAQGVAAPGSEPPAGPSPQQDAIPAAPAVLALEPGVAASAPAAPPASATPPQAAAASTTAPAGSSISQDAQSAPAPTVAAPRTAGPPGIPPRFRPAKLGWDVNLEGAYGRNFPSDGGFGFARFRGGLLYAVDPVFYAVGLTYEWSNLEAATFGIQAEGMQIETGLWLQLGGLIDTQAHPGASAAVGWSILGAELQLRKFDPNDYGFAAVAKLRIPITFIAQAF